MLEGREVVDEALVVPESLLNGGGPRREGESLLVVKEGLLGTSACQRGVGKSSEMVADELGVGVFGARKFAFLRWRRFGLEGGLIQDLLSFGELLGFGETSDFIREGLARREAETE